MRITKEIAGALSAEMMIYEERMLEIAYMLDSMESKGVVSVRYLGKAATLAEEAERMIFSVRNTLCLALEVKLEHKYPAAEDKDHEQES